MRVTSKAIVLKQMSANDYADEVRMAVGDAIEEYADTYMAIASVAELAEQIGLTEKKVINLLAGDIDIKLSDLARYAYMMGCGLRITLERKDTEFDNIKIGGTE